MECSRMEWSVVVYLGSRGEQESEMVLGLSGAVIVVVCACWIVDGRITF